MLPCSSPRCLQRTHARASPSVTKQRNTLAGRAPRPAATGACLHARRLAAWRRRRHGGRRAARAAAAAAAAAAVGGGSAARRVAGVAPHARPLKRLLGLGPGRARALCAVTRRCALRCRGDGGGRQAGRRLASAPRPCCRRRADLAVGRRLRRGAGAVRAPGH